MPNEITSHKPSGNSLNQPEGSNSVTIRNQGENSNFPTEHAQGLTHALRDFAAQFLLRDWGFSSPLLRAQKFPEWFTGLRQSAALSFSGFFNTTLDAVGLGFLRTELNPEMLLFLSAAQTAMDQQDDPGNLIEFKFYQALQEGTYVFEMDPLYDQILSHVEELLSLPGELLISPEEEESFLEALQQRQFESIQSYRDRLQRLERTLRTNLTIVQTSTEEARLSDYAQIARRRLHLILQTGQVPPKSVVVRGTEYSFDISVPKKISASTLKDVVIFIFPKNIQPEFFKLQSNGKHVVVKFYDLRLVLNHDRLEDSHNEIKFALAEHFGTLPWNIEFRKKAPQEVPGKDLNLGKGKLYSFPGADSNLRLSHKNRSVVQGRGSAPVRLSLVPNSPSPSHADSRRSINPLSDYFVTGDSLSLAEERDYEDQVPEHWEAILITVIDLSNESGLSEVAAYLEFTDDREARILFTDQTGLYRHLIKRGMSPVAIKIKQANVELSVEQIIQIHAALYANAMSEFDFLIKSVLPSNPTPPLGPNSPVVGLTTNGVMRNLSVLRVR